jgi:hypothetical protein
LERARIVGDAHGEMRGLERHERRPLVGLAVDNDRLGAPAARELGRSFRDGAEADAGRPGEAREQDGVSDAEANPKAVAEAEMWHGSFSPDEQAGARIFD